MVHLREVKVEEREGIGEIELNQVLIGSGEAAEALGERFVQIAVFRAGWSGLKVVDGVGENGARLLNQLAQFLNLGAGARVIRHGQLEVINDRLHRTEGLTEFMGYLANDRGRVFALTISSGEQQVVSVTRRGLTIRAGTVHAKSGIISAFPRESR